MTSKFGLTIYLQMYLEVPNKIKKSWPELLVH